MTMTSEEKAVVQAAIRLHRIGGDGKSMPDQNALRTAVHQLIFACAECNAGGHTCPGDGNPIGHGDSDCGQHDDAVVKPSEEREQRRLELEFMHAFGAMRWARCDENRRALNAAWENLTRWHGTLAHHLADLDQELAEYRPAPEPEMATASLVATRELRDALSGDLLPAGQDADLERMGREMAEDPLIWVARTLVDVRAGDTIRMPGQEGTKRVVETVSPVLPWHVHPAGGRDAEFHPERYRAEWSEIKVTFIERVTDCGCVADPSNTGECGHIKRTGPLPLKPDMPVEIQMTAGEVAGIEALGGWANRVRTTTAPNASGADRD
jgi:hypothetical protein